MPISISLIAPPMYVITTTALQEAEGVDLLKKALEKLGETIKEYQGNLVVKVEVSNWNEKSFWMNWWMNELMN